VGEELPNNRIQFTVSTPTITFSGKELVGRKRWPDCWWADKALKEFEKLRGFIPEQSDLVVKRVKG